MAYSYKKVALGGTFDHLHAGHKTLLRTAFSMSRHVVIGITSDAMVAHKKHAVALESYVVRRKHLRSYLQAEGYMGRSTLMQLHDEFGSALSDPAVEAIIAGPRVSEETISRIEKHKDVIRIPEVLARDRNELSSTRIRNGEIARDGSSYYFEPHDVVLPRSLRPIFRKPMGVYVSSIAQIITTSPLMISVGDASFIKLISEGIYPNIIILDGMIKRKHVFTEKDIQRIAGTKYTLIRTENVSGALSGSLIRTVRETVSRARSYKDNYIILVRGEDDLAVMPAVSFAPLTSVVVYGQPAFPARSIRPGLIQVVVNEKHKAYVSDLITQFNKS